MAFQRQIAGEVLTREDSRLAQQFAATHPGEVAHCHSRRTPHFRATAAGFPGLTYAVAAQQILQRGERGPFPVSILTEDISARLLVEGINPGGFAKDVLWSDPRRCEDSWRKLYEWQAGGQPTPRVNPPLTQREQDHLQLIRDAAMREVTDAIFASGRRSLESLGIGLATVDRLRFPASRQLAQEAADGVIQLLGSRRNRLDTHGANPQTNPPRYVTQYLQRVAAYNGESPPDFEREVYDLLHLSQVCDPAQTGVLFSRHLCLIRPGDEYYVCPQCRRLHLHGAGALCIECLEPLDGPRPISEMPIEDDYYRYLALHSGDVFRLNCEELTGQTNKSDARRRQRLFQNRCLRGLKKNPAPMN